MTFEQGDLVLVDTQAFRGAHDGDQTERLCTILQACPTIYFVMSIFDIVIANI